MNNNQVFKAGLFEFQLSTVRSVGMNDQFLGGRINEDIHLFQRNDAKQNFVRTGQDEIANAGTPVFKMDVNGTNVHSVLAYGMALILRFFSITFIGGPAWA